MEFVRLILDASPDRARLITTACAVNTGVSCSATPGCAGGDKLRGDDPDDPMRGDGVLVDRGSSSSFSSTVALSTEIKRSRNALVDGARGGSARDADAATWCVTTPLARGPAGFAGPAGDGAATPSRRVASSRTPSVSDSSSSLPLGAADDDGVRERKGQYLE